MERAVVMGRWRGLHWHHQPQQPPLHTRVKLQLQLQLQKEAAAAGRWSSSAYACRMIPLRREQMPSVGGWARIAFPSITRIGWLSSGKQCSAVFAAAGMVWIRLIQRSDTYILRLTLFIRLSILFCVTKSFIGPKSADGDCSEQHNWAEGDSAGYGGH